MAANKGFKITADPMKPKDSTRNVVSKATDQGERNNINRGVRQDNPKHHYASKLEDQKGGAGAYYKPTSDTLCTPGPARSTPSHAFDRKQGIHSHMGTSGKGHKFPGRRT